MRRIKCTVQYDGTWYAGYQVQPNSKTIQGEIEKVLEKIHGKPIRISASGRTDAGVHAIGQVFHFDTDTKFPVEKWLPIFNSQLPNDIVVNHVEEVAGSFHSRFGSIEKEYQYKVYRGPHKSPFLIHHAYHVPHSLSVQKMEEASRYLLGTHDFTSFCSAKTEVEDKVRTIFTISMEEEENMLTFSLVGNGFLYNMVRIIIGVLIEVGQGKRAPIEVKEILEAKDRRAGGKTAPAQGLYLYRVKYSNDN
ncbi:tRNA pseudouridine synthase A [Bacillus coahuilensis p1.1.43]|uniref:tRNA pseudouridine synthase A n=1 Tax=Bacillus coahuilensis p1.1.43 TaxID=1150625 RepID=A0A147K5G2_9BACI|nr:tRNA pseudouridine(38-40) synthase TruA [Bacillus coahuilensis]KUP04820.1 tRNA pseudouridine synthase A [Bacillus coahuilensis p1.1.43]